MRIKFNTPSYIQIEIYWSGDFNLGASKNFFFSSDKSDIEKAKEMKLMFPTLFEFDFYSEEGIEKVIVGIKNNTVLCVR